jgi:6-phosphogluconate dehydrogenase
MYARLQRTREQGSLPQVKFAATLWEAQRDFFGAHTFERIDAKGSFHAEWS